MNTREQHKKSGTSYIIVFIILSITLFLLMAKNVVADNDSYKAITVHEGETLWSIAGQYGQETPGLTRNGFIQWVEDHNRITRNHIEPDQELFIPVHK
ncbi:LysM peptidoglycan-binding domain-containing protein [Sporolactobacillus sp. Y61]|uniref:LysM peptidoglycan-binding domain-containing protein n=1 Tax=Sporolactobacillus sp. Y61 TaxID=3160863 RepID=A0AAU8IDT2_9BACL|nr:LysM peptidoglycan-binding domain-containing protein [Sporolactobacillus sp. THM19-2]RYL92216.1 LysM peptidoglycan-binding domain-containing protein [Sporolactobacillus sp. THM19-2]